jgi:hypothetical protein
MKTTAMLTVLLGVALATPVDAQTVRTKSFVHEQIHLRLSGFQSVEGWLHMEDIGGVGSVFEILVFNVETRAVLFSCRTSAPIDVPPSEFRDFDIVQVGQFAQQATADAEPIMDFIQGFYNRDISPVSLTLTCPFQEQTIATAPHHNNL